MLISCPVPPFLSFCCDVMLQPELYVSQTGKRSVVNILPPDEVVDPVRHIYDMDVPDITARPRSGPPVNFGHDADNIHVLTSSVVCVPFLFCHTMYCCTSLYNLVAVSLCRWQLAAFHTHPLPQTVILPVTSTSAGRPRPVECLWPNHQCFPESGFQHNFQLRRIL